MRLSELAKKINAKLYGNQKIKIFRVASIEAAKNGDVTFLTNNLYRKKLLFCKASAVILQKKDLKWCKSAALVVKNPYLTYINVVKILYPLSFNQISYISNSAVIKNYCNLGKNIIIGENTVIESGVIIEDNVKIGSGCIIGKNSIIRSYSVIHSNVTIYHEIEIGKHCFIQSNSVIGSDGFGYINDQKIWIKIPHLGKVKIGNYVEIGSCTTIDRGTLDYTEIQNGVIIDNQCQIAHNVVIKKNTAIAGGVIIGGGTKIGCNCKIGGATVINNNITICDKVIVTGMGMVMRSIKKSGIYSSGVPIQPNKVWRKTAVLVMKIDKIYKRLKTLEQKYFKI